MEIPIINNHYNYCFYNDIIGMMPTNYNYKHSCNLFKIRKNGVIVLCKNDIWYKRLYVFLSNKNCYNIFKNYNLESYLYFFYILCSIFVLFCCFSSAYLIQHKKMNISYLRTLLL